MAICVVSNFLWWWAKYHNGCNLDIIGNSWWFFFLLSLGGIPECKLKNIWKYSERGCVTPHDLYVPSHTTCKSSDYHRAIKGNLFPSQAALLRHKISLNQAELAPEVHSDSWVPWPQILFLLQIMFPVDMRIILKRGPKQGCLHTPGRLLTIQAKLYCAKSEGQKAYDNKLVRINYW